MKRLLPALVLAGAAWLAMPATRAAEAAAGVGAAGGDTLRWVEVDGARLACVERGAGEPVVLVHGSLGDWRSWRPHLAALSRTCRVVAYSRRFHHPNPDGGPENSMARDARDLEGLVRALELGPVHLVGHGRGAEVAARFAAEHPEAVRSLVLCEPAFPGLLTGAGEARAFAAGRNEIRQRVRLALRDGFPDVALRAYVDGSHGASVDDLPDSALARARDNLEALRREMLAAPEAGFDCASAGRIAAPVLYVNGGRSPAAMRSLAADFAGCRPGTEQVVLSRAAHDVPREASGAFLRTVSRFLASPAVRAYRPSAEAAAR